MLTPQEVQDKKFKQSFINGYDMTSVDSFLETLTDDYTNLFKENAVLKNKMKVLVDKLEEYRSQEDTVRQAYVAIKQQAEAELSKAQEKAGEIILEAQNNAEAQKTYLAVQLANEEKRLTFAQDQTVTFVKALRELYTRQIDQLSVIPAMEIAESPKEKRAENVREAVRDIENSVSRLNDDDEPEPAVDSTQAFIPPDIDFNREMLEEFDQADVTAPTAVIPDDMSVEVQKKIDENIKSFEINFGPGVLPDDNSDIWEPEYDTEIPRPKFDFTGIEQQFGPETSVGKRK